MSHLIATAYMAIGRGLTAGDIASKLPSDIAHKVVTEAAYEYSIAMRQCGKRWGIDGFLATL